MAKADNPTTVSELTPDNSNANKGTERGTAMLETSLRRVGMGRSILIDKNNRVIAGNKTVEQAGQIGISKVRVIETDGTEVIAVKRTDLDLDTVQGREMAIADNRVGEANLSWNPEVIAELKASGVALDTYFTEGELATLSAPPDDVDVAGHRRGLGAAVISYEIIFDDEAQQARFFDFIRYLKGKYPDATSLGERLFQYLATADLKA